MNSYNTKQDNQVQDNQIQCNQVTVIAYKLALLQRRFEHPNNLIRRKAVIAFHYCTKNEIFH